MENILDRQIRLTTNQQRWNACVARWNELGLDLYQRSNCWYLLNHELGNSMASLGNCLTVALSFAKANLDENGKTIR